MNIKEIREVGDYLFNKGISPLDLLSWHTLLYLEEKTREIDITNCLDRSVHSFFRHNVIESLKGKADMLDKESSTTFHIDLIKKICEI